MPAPPERPRLGLPLGRWGAGFYDGLGLLGGLVLAAITAAVFVQVVLRYVFVYAIEGLEEIPRYLFVWLVALGAAAAMYRGEHTALDYFARRLPPRAQAIVAVVTHGAGLALLGSLMWTSFVLVPNAQLQTSPGLGLPLGYVYAAVPVGAFLIALPMVWSLVTALARLLRTWQRPS